MAVIAVRRLMFQKSSGNVTVLLAPPLICGILC